MPIKVNSPVDEIYSTLRMRILNERYTPGEKLSETGLAKEFDCSRTPIREVLKRLEQDGLIVIQPKSGSYIKTHNKKDHKNLMEVRSYIEGLSVRLLIEDKKPTTTLTKILDEMDEILSSQPIDIILFGEKHYEFHHTLVELSGNELSLQTFERLNLRSSMLFYQSMNEKSVLLTQNEHRKIVTLINEGSSKSEKFTIEHLWKKRNRYIP